MVDYHKEGLEAVKNKNAFCVHCGEILIIKEKKLYCPHCKRECGDISTASVFKTWKLGTQPK